MGCFWVWMMRRRRPNLGHRNSSLVLKDRVKLVGSEVVHHIGPPEGRSIPKPCD
jgi:hypothetical protein